MNRVTSLRGVGLLLIAAIAWGGLFPVAMVILPALDPFHMTAIRYGITAIIFVGLLAVAEGPRALKLEGRGLRAALLGTAGFAGLGLLLFVGLQHSRPEHGAIIMATQPLIAAVTAWLLRGVRPARATLAFLGVALLGVLLVVTKGHFTGVSVGGTGFGDLMMFLGAVSWVIYSLGAADFPSVATALYGAHVHAQPASNSWRDDNSDRDRLRFHPERRRRRIVRLATRVYHRDRFRARRVVLECGQQAPWCDQRDAVHQLRSGHRVRDSDRAGTSFPTNRVRWCGAGDQRADR